MSCQHSAALASATSQRLREKLGTRSSVEDSREAEPMAMGMESGGGGAGAKEGSFREKVCKAVWMDCCTN